MDDKKLDKWFKIACYAECISCVLLFFVAMPLKYSFQNTVLMIPAGIIHGIFFTLYIILAVWAKKLYKWDDEDLVFAIMSAFFPFATIWVEKSLTKIDKEKS
jgi:integral membrane protein